MDMNIDPAVQVQSERDEKPQRRGCGRELCRGRSVEEPIWRRRANYAGHGGRETHGP